MSARSKRYKSNLEKFDLEKTYLLDDSMDDAVKSDIDGLYISVKPSNYEKCVRCWHRDSSVGKNDSHNQLCARCINNVYENGEVRLHA